MSVLVLLLMVLMVLMVMKSEAASAQIITVSTHSNETVLLSPGLRMGTMKHRWDVRWTHSHLLLSLKKNMTACHHRRCELLNDGSLRFSRVQTQDSGSYSLEVFDEHGMRLMRKDFLLQVEAEGYSSSSMSTAVSIFCFFLFLFFLFTIIFILRRRRMKTKTGTSVSGPVEDNVYVRMFSHRANTGKDDAEKEKQENEEEPIYVPCCPGAATETTMTKHTPEEADNVYM